MTHEERVAKIQSVGGFAFPCSIAMGDGSTYADAGMSMRDYFAAQAMLAITAGSEGGWLGYSDAEELAGRSYAFADAMLAARSK